MNQKYSEQDVAVLVSLHHQGLTVAEISKKQNMWTNTVKRLLIQAGVSPRYPACPRYGTDVDAEMHKLFNKGLNPNQIAKKLNISAITVIRHLQKLGMGDKLTTRPTYDDEVQQQLIRLHQEGNTPNAIAMLLKISPSTVRKILIRAGLAPRQVPMHESDTVKAILRLRDRGQSVPSISAELGVPKATVYYWVRKQPNYESKVYRKRVKKPEFSPHFSQPMLGHTPPKLSDRLILGVVRLDKTGFTSRQIARKLKVDLETVEFILTA